MGKRKQRMFYAREEERRDSGIRCCWKG